MSVPNINRLFDLYAANLSLYLPEHQGLFLCPLCFRLFSRDAIASKTLTLEHVIPSAIQGRLTTLTCVECNRRHGSLLEANLIQRLRTEDILAGKSKDPLRVRIQTDQGEFGANVFFSDTQDPNIRILGIPEISNPSLHSAAHSDFEGGNPKISIEGRLGYKEVPSRVAALRMVYLLMFRYFGYGYVLFSHADCIREQLASPVTDGDPLRGLLWLREPPLKNSIAILQEPAELRCFLAILDLSTEDKRYLAVVLPGTEPNSENVYRRLRAMPPEQLMALKPKIDFISFDEGFLSDAGYRHFPLRLWRGQAKVVSANH